MRPNKQKTSIKWPAPLILILISGSILLLGGDFPFHNNDTKIKAQGTLSQDTLTTAQSSTFSIQSHLSTSTAGISPTNGSINHPTTTSNYGITLPPGSPLPGDSTCASLVNRSSFEPRPDNYSANHRVPTTQQITVLLSGPGDVTVPLAVRKRVTGDFTGTTDEIFQWAGCKWGINVNIIRAEAVMESYWHESDRGDWTTNSSLCPPNTWNGKGCYQSYGILQIKYIYSKTTWPMSGQDTAFNVDYAYSYIRACYEGLLSFLSEKTPVTGYPRYHAGDIWGCVGSYYSGGWYDQGAINYINQVKAYLAHKVWLQPGF
jgi:hypothetical protein